MNLFSKEVLEYIFQPCDQEEKPPPQDQVPKILNEEFLISKKSYRENSLEKLREINNKNCQTDGIVKGLDQEGTVEVLLSPGTFKVPPDTKISAKLLKKLNRGIPQ